MFIYPLINLKILTTSIPFLSFIIITATIKPPSPRIKNHPPSINQVPLTVFHFDYFSLLSIVFTINTNLFFTKQRTPKKCLPSGKY